MNDRNRQYGSSTDAAASRSVFDEILALLGLARAATSSRKAPPRDPSQDLSFQVARAQRNLKQHYNDVSFQISQGHKAFVSKQSLQKCLVLAAFAFFFLLDWLYRMLFGIRVGIISVDQEFLLASMCGIFSFVFHLKQKQDDENTKKEKIKREGAKIIRHGDMAARNLRSKLMSDLRTEQDRRQEKYLYMPRGGQRGQERDKDFSGIFDQADGTISLKKPKANFQNQFHQDTRIYEKRKLEEEMRFRNMTEGTERSKTTFGNPNITYWDPIVETRALADDRNGLERQPVVFSYLQSFNESENNRLAQIQMRQHLKQMRSSTIGECVERTKHYILNFFFSMILQEYVDKLKAFMILAQKHGFNLLPERMYLLPNGRLNKSHMIDAVINVFDQNQEKMSSDLQSYKNILVDSFIEFASGINEPDFEKKHRRPMSQKERELAIEAKSCGQEIQELQRIFRSISRVSEKYIGCETYVIMRMAQLVQDPQSFHPFEIEQGNQKRFCPYSSSDSKSNTAQHCLPSDSEIVASVFAAFMDWNVGSKQPRHYFDYRYATHKDSRNDKLKEYMAAFISERAANKAADKYCGGIINTQPVAASSNQCQNVPHFESINGDSRVPILSGRNNVFYCIMMNLAFIYKKCKRVGESRQLGGIGAMLGHQRDEMHRFGASALTVKCGRYDWVDAVHLVFGDNLYLLNE